MTQHLVRLPVRLVPVAGEGVRGYLQRLATANGLERIDQFGKNRQLSLKDLAALVGRDDSTFWVKHPQSIYWEKVNALKKVHWNWATRRCCPTCLAEEPIWKIEWEMRAMAVCSTHGVRLIDTCPACGETLSWNTKELTECKCGRGLRKVHVEPRSDQEIDLAKALSFSAGNGGCPESMSNLQRMTTSDMFRLIYFLGRYGLGQEEVKVSDTTSMVEISPLFEKAANTLSDWPNNYHLWITRLKGEEGSSSISMSIPDMFGKAYDYIYRSLYEKQFNFIRTEFESYLVSKWNWPLNNRNKRIPHELREDNSWIPITAAAEKLKVGKKVIQHLIDEKVLEAVMIPSRTGRIFVSVNSNELWRAKNHLAEIVNLSRTSEIMGISEARVIELCEGEILQPIATVDESGTGQWQFSLTDIRWITSYAGEAPVREQVGEDQVLLRNLLKSGLRGTGTFANLLRLVHNGRITVVGRLKEVTGLSGWIIKQQEYDHWVREQIDNLQLGYTVQEACKILGIKQEVGYALVRNGILRSQTQTFRCRKTVFISPEDLKSFNDNYVFARTLAEELGTSPRAIVERMAANGVMPVAGPGINDCRQVLFERKAIASRQNDLSMSECF